MKKFSKIILLLICSGIFIHCNQANKVETKQKVETRKKPKTIPSNVDDDFSLFLKTFSQDSVFQISRVQFPLKTKEWMDPEVGMVEKLISKSDYSTLDFTYPEDAMTRELDRYSQKINNQGNKCVVEIRGIDNGIYTDFYFEKINGKWYLISWEEQST